MLWKEDILGKLTDQILKIVELVTENLIRRQADISEMHAGGFMPWNYRFSFYFETVSGEILW